VRSRSLSPALKELCGDGYTLAVMARKPRPPRGPQLELAGALPVAFVNTAGARKDNRQQGVASYAELIAWGRQVGVLSALEAERLRLRAAARPAEAQEVFGVAAKLRALLFRLFLAVATGKELPEGDLAALSDALDAALPAVRLARGEGGVEWGWAGDPDALDRVLWPVLLSAAELLISLENRPHVKQCAAEGCTLFFVDRTPSGRRRWCEMKTCGNRAKSLRYYHRTGKHERGKPWLYPR